MSFTSESEPSDEITVIIREPVPPRELISRTSLLPTGVDARDTCGDGSQEYKHIDPLAVWKNLPILYFIDLSSVPSDLIQGVIDSFNVWNTTAGFTLYQRTTSESNSKIQVSFETIDGASSTLAEARWSYSPTRGEMTRATITFDDREDWGLLTNESCGSNGSVFDVMQVGVHEVGHLSGLDHAPTDRLQTMYASTGPGQTLGRTLGNGDILGFKTAYDIDIVIPPPPPPVPPVCPPGQHLQNGVCVPDTPPPAPPSPLAKIITQSGIKYVDTFYQNRSGQYLSIAKIPIDQSQYGKVITISGKSYLYTYFYRTTGIFATLGRVQIS